MSKAVSELFAALWLSVRISTLATIIAALFGIPLAYRMARISFPGKSLLESLILLPLVLPPTVVGYMLIMTLGAQGWFARWLHGYSIVLRFEGAVLAAAVVALPLIYLPAKSAFASVDREFEDVARVMGANRFQLFWHVSLPLAIRGLLSGLILAFARALGEFGATLMVFGLQPRKLTLPVSVYLSYEQGQFSSATAAVITLSAISLGLVMLYNASSAGRQAELR